MIDNLTEDNFLLYAANHYISPHYIHQEFYHDLKKIKYIKRAITTYKTKGILKERIILNHIILLYNVFHTDACTKMLFFRINEQDYSQLKTFLIYLNYMPDMILSIKGRHVYSCDIPLDNKIITALRSL